MQQYEFPATHHLARTVPGGVKADAMLFINPEVLMILEHGEIALARYWTSKLVDVAVADMASTGYQLSGTHFAMPVGVSCGIVRKAGLGDLAVQILRHSHLAFHQVDAHLATERAKVAIKLMEWSTMEPAPLMGSSAIFFRDAFKINYFLLCKALGLNEVSDQEFATALRPPGENFTVVPTPNRSERSSSIWPKATTS